MVCLEEKNPQTYANLFIPVVLILILFASYYCFTISTNNCCEGWQNTRFGWCQIRRAMYSYRCQMVRQKQNQKKKKYTIFLPSIFRLLSLPAYFSIVMPIVTREVTLHLEPGLTANASLDLSNLGFLLGTFPSAPGILFYAMQYNVAVDMVSETNSFCLI